MGAFVPVIHASCGDRANERDTTCAADAVSAALVRLGHRSPVIALDPDFSPLRGLASKRPLAVFNLVEAVDGSAALAPLGAVLLAHLGLTFTGASAAAWWETLSKTGVKQRLRAAGLPTADWWLADDPVPPDVTVIVKSVIEHGSLGMDASSVVPGSAAAAEMRARARRFGGSFFAERFLPGREFNVALLGTAAAPEMLPIQEIVFDLPAGAVAVVDYAAKWEEGSPACRGTLRRFGIERREPALAQRLRALAVEVWTLFALSGYARIDIRSDAAGEPFILEVNVNPCLTPDAGFVAAAARAGLDYDAMIARILALATGDGTERRCCAS